jgi:hypothetical protein
MSLASRETNTAIARRNEFPEVPDVRRRTDFVRKGLLGLRMTDLKEKKE